MMILSIFFLVGPGNQRSDFTDLILLAIVTLSPLFAVSASVASCITDNDAIYTILDTYVLPDILYRSLRVTAIHTILRFSFYLFVFAEVTRGVGLFVCLIIILGNRINSITRKCQRKWKEARGSLREYKLCYIVVVCVVGEDAGKILYIIFYTLFWVTVGSVWVVVMKTPPSIPIPLYISICGLTLICLIVSLVIFPLISAIHNNALECLVFRRFIAAFKYSKFHSIRNRALLQEVRSMRPFMLRYLKFQVINQEFLVDYFWNVAMRTCDAILILDT